MTDAELAQFDQYLAGTNRTLDNLIAAYTSLRAKGTSEVKAMSALMNVYLERDRREEIALLAAAVRRLAELRPAPRTVDP